MPRLFPILVFILTLSFSYEATQAADVKKLSESNAAWLKKLTRKPPGPHAKIRPVTLNFDLGWKNKLNAGKFTVTINESAQNNQPIYIGEAVGKTTGMARLLWPYDVQAKAYVNQQSLRPKIFELKEKERNQAGEYKIRFEPDKLVCDMTLRHKKKNKGKPSTSNYQFHHDFLHDILSAIFYVRSQELTQNEELSLMISPYNKPYLANFKVTGREKHKTNKKTHKTIRLNLEIKKIRPDFSLGSYSKVKKITLWITDDEYRFPLELQAEVFVGYVTASLTSRKWLD